MNKEITDKIINIQTKEVLDMSIISELKDNAMLKVNPHLFEIWDFEENNKLSFKILEMTKGMHKKAWWICTKCNENYDMYIYDKVAGKNCPYCANKRIGKNNSLAVKSPHIAKLWHPTKNGELTPHDVAPKSHNEYWWLGKCGHYWDMRVDDMNRYNGGCPYCSGSRLLVGYNDMWTTNSKLANMLANPEDGYRYMQSASAKLNWKCPTCSKILKNKSINNVSKQGVSCEICNDSVSFGEKMIYQILLQSDIDFKFDQATEFSGRLRYDFILESYNIVIEAHGLQHYIDTGFHKMNGKNSESEMKNDIYKRRIAEENKYRYFEINCSKSDFVTIKKEIIDSGILKILKIEEDVFNKINMSHSLVEECWNLWNSNGMKKIEIAEKLGIGRNRVARYIKLREQLNQERVG